MTKYYCIDCFVEKKIIWRKHHLTRDMIDPARSDCPGKTSDPIPESDCARFANSFITNNIGKSIHISQIRNFGLIQLNSKSLSKIKIFIKSNHNLDLIKVKNLNNLSYKLS